MLIVSRTPVRISLFGGGTDYPAYYMRKRGAVVGGAINKYTHISLSTPQPFFAHKYRIAYSKTELVSDLNEIEHPSVRECLKEKQIDAHLDVHIFSDLPARTGLGSSSSFTVGFLNSLHALEGKRVGQDVLAEQACFIEQQRIKENVGSQDQFHAAIGGLNIFSFSEQGIDVRPLLISKEKRALLEGSLLLFFTGITRFASEVVKEQVKRTHSLDNDAYLDEMLRLVFDFEKVVVEQSGDEMLQSIGKMLDESWRMKKQLSSKVSKTEIDALYEKALEAGAYGGKLCGAGGGGFLLLLVPSDKQPQVRAAMGGALEVPFSFEDEGSKIIYMKDS